MSYVVKNDWKWDKQTLKNELYRVLEDHGVNEYRDGGLHGIALSSQDGSLESGFNFNVKIPTSAPTKLGNEPSNELLYQSNICNK